MMGVNPIEESVFDEADIARRQYAALLRYADDPTGLTARVERDRETELTSYHHSLRARFGMQMAHIVTLGIYSHHETDLTALAEERRAARQIQFLGKVAKSSPQAEIVWNMEEVRRAVDQIAASPLPRRSAKLVQQIMRQTNDEETRALCAQALQNLESASGGGGMR
jgi:hypothetical protein